MPKAPPPPPPKPAPSESVLRVRKWRSERTPEQKEAMKKYQKAYRAVPENKAKAKAYHMKYHENNKG